ncbi:MAG: branched-chain amino acid ABC transporter permease [Anaerolineales bacterium]|jgi:branched-chain amino acid transport system permease protein
MLRNWRQRVSLTDVIVWAIGVVLAAGVIYGTIVTLRAEIYAGRTWIDLTITGLALGGVYALIALGYTLVYGILKMINFAHGEVFMSGPFTAVFLAIYLDNIGFLNTHPIISLLMITILSATVATTIAVLLERIAYKPLRGAPRLVPLITAIGASFFLQYTFRGLYGSGIKAYPEIDVLQGSWEIAGISIVKTQAVSIVGAVLMMLVIWGISRFTRVGKAMRAVSEDQEVSALMGIDVDRTIMNTFALGGAAAGVAGILYVLLFPIVNFFMGFIPGLKAFTAAVLGGIGNPIGAFLGAMVLGLIEAIGPSLFLTGLGIPAPYQLKDALAFVILVLILIFRPTGILGERISRTKA